MMRVFDSRSLGRSRPAAGRRRPGGPWRATGGRDQDGNSRPRGAGGNTRHSKSSDALGPRPAVGGERELRNSARRSVGCSRPELWQRPDRQHHRHGVSGGGRVAFRPDAGWMPRLPTVRRRPKRGQARRADDAQGSCSPPDDQYGSAESDRGAEPAQRRRSEAETARAHRVADARRGVRAVDGQLITAGPAGRQVRLVAGQPEGKPAERPGRVAGRHEVGHAEAAGGRRRGRGADGGGE